MNETQGPAMICATSVVKPGRARIGQIGGNVTLPRTVEIMTLFAVAAGFLAGLALAAFVPTGGSQKYFMGGIFGGAAGWFIVTFSPMQNESLLTWLGLTVKTLRQQRYVEGRPVVLAVGVSMVEREAVGRVRLVRGAIRIPAGTFDDRGVPRTAANRNLPDGAIAAAGAFVTGVKAPMPAVGARAMPTDEEVAAAPIQRSALTGGGNSELARAGNPDGAQSPEARPAGQSPVPVDHGGTTVVEAPWTSPDSTHSSFRAAPSTPQQPSQDAPAAGQVPPAVDAFFDGAQTDASPRFVAPTPGSTPRLRIREQPAGKKPGKPRKLRD